MSASVRGMSFGARPRRLVSSPSDMRSLLAASLCLAVLPLSHARADLYTFTDSNGVVHYSNTPPPRARG
ncbi:MAG TPA: hypothetical protein DEF51_45685, partial [Myxococcales bacterium]|nr:hypothetical protein [Myxococcales bacterium]